MAFFFLHLYRLRSRRTAGGFSAPLTGEKTMAKNIKYYFDHATLSYKKVRITFLQRVRNVPSVVNYDRFGMDNHILYDS